MAYQDYEAVKRMFHLAHSGNARQLQEVANSTNSNTWYQGLTPLMKAAMAPNNRGFGCAKLLLDINARLSQRDSIGSTVMHWTAVHNNTEVMKLLKKRRYRLVHQTNRLGDTPLMWAAAVNNPKAAQQLIKWGAGLGDLNKMGESAVDKAKMFGAWSAFVAITSAIDQAPLDETHRQALLEKEVEAKRICSLAERCDLQQLKRVANCNNCNCRWRSLTPLMWTATCVNSGAIECAKFLLGLGADASLTDWRGQTAAHYAAMAHCCRLQELLIAARFQGFGAVADAGDSSDESEGTSSHIERNSEKESEEENEQEEME